MTTHGGAPSGLLDFSANIAPLGMHPAAQSALAALALDADALSRYPDSSCAALRTLLAQFWSLGTEPAALGADAVVCGAGAVDVLFALVRTFGRGRGKIVVVEPAFSEYARAAQVHGCAVAHFLPAREDGALAAEDVPRLAPLLDGAAMLFVASPSNPAGALTDGDTLCALAALCERKAVAFVLDACFAPFAAAAEEAVRGVLSRRRAFPHTVVVGAFTKCYGMAGIRLGYALCGSDGVARQLADGMRPWAVGAGALAAGEAVMRAEVAEKQGQGGTVVPSSWERQTRAVVAAERARVADFLRSCACRVVGGAANYVLFRCDDTRLAERMRTHGIAIRSCADYFGLDAHWYRVAVRTAEENGRLVAALSACLKKDAPFAPVGVTRGRKRTANIMIQGTMSNAGKSVLVAALCRMFAQDGYRVAPFKSQNMALNSGVTADGMEMGRAQIMQAEAAGIPADVRMNPVLLKPTGETGSQVVVNGVPLGTMDARAYVAYRASLVPQIMAAYRSLAAEHDIIVIEGAGSPAEINLRDGDIVNMGLAELTDAPVLLAGDIDRGGVFASLYGTVALLPARERARIKGLVINKFRGDVSLLRGGLDQIAALTGIPVLGVVPFLDGLMLDGEDSLAEAVAENRKKADVALRVGVVRLPYLSNATDLLPFSRLPSVRVDFIAAPGDCMGADMLVLPGTKNAVRALAWLRRTGMDRAIVRAAQDGIPVVGICGGFQLLGNALHDADGNEDDSAPRSVPALGLLPVETTFGAEKTRARVDTRLPALSGTFAALSGRAVRGYEIHHGRTAFADGGDCGIVCARGNVLGTYLHGFFDSDDAFDATLSLLCARKGIPVPLHEPYQNAREAAYDRLAAAVRASLDMDAVYRVVFGADSRERFP